MHESRSRSKRAGRIVAWGTLVATLGLMAEAASAVSVSIATIDSPSPLDQLSVGDEFTLGIVLSNADQDPIAGIGIGAFGWDRRVLRGIGFETTQSVFSQSVVSTPEGPLAVGGLPNSAVGFSVSRAVADQHFDLIAAISLTPSMGTGLSDLGVDGGLISEGDVHARIRFEVIGGGAASVSFGGLTSNGDGVVIPRGEDVLVEETNIASLDIMASGPVFEPPVIVVPPVDPPPPIADPPPVVDPPSDPDPPVGDPPPPLIVVLMGTIFPPDMVFPEGALYLPWSSVPDGARFPEGTIFLAGMLPPVDTTPPNRSSHGGRPIPEPSSALLILAGLAVLAAGRGARSRAAVVGDRRI